MSSSVKVLPVPRRSLASTSMDTAVACGVVAVSASATIWSATSVTVTASACVVASSRSLACTVTS